MSDKKEEFKLRPYSPQELRVLYGISYVTLQKWIKPFAEEIGKPIGRVYNINQVKIIIEKLGFPETIKY